MNFTDTINEEAGYSTYGLVSNTECGMQTGVSLLERLELLDTELTARKIVRPVLLMADKHASRFSEHVAAFCKEKEIDLFFEPGGTSGFLQALDQYNKKFHEAYKNGKSAFRSAEKARMKDNNYSAPINTNAFLKIISTIWFSWSTKLDRIRSFQKVGITCGGLFSELVSRRGFVATLELRGDDPDAAAEADGAPPLMTVREPPIGLRAGSLEAAQWKVGELERVLANVTATPYTPAEHPSMLTPEIRPALKPASRGKRLTDVIGSTRMQDLHGMTVEARKEREAEGARKGENKAARDAVKAEKEAEKIALVAAFERCKGAQGCQCGVAPCPMARMVWCSNCHDIKTCVCRKHVCQAAKGEVPEAGDDEEDLLDQARTSDRKLRSMEDAGDDDLFT
jgi:hypothetical protein